MRNDGDYGMREFFRVFSEKKRRGLIQYRRRLYRGRTSWPYLSGDAFSRIADYAPYGANGLRQPQIEYINQARSIFIPGHFLSDFIDRYGELVNAKVLITGNSDHNFTEWPNLPDSITLWLGQNLALPQPHHLKTLTIPIGLENLALGRSGLPKLITSKLSSVYDRVLVPPMALSNPIREAVLAQLDERMEVYEVFTKYMDEKKYFELVNDYQFVLCLEGNGFENHRIWETLYRNAFPVMLRTTWSMSLKHLALPILYLDDISDCNVSTLNQFLSVHKGFKAKNHESLWMSYWKDLVSRTVDSEALK